MRKVILFAHTSLDGFMAGPNGELDWIAYDSDLAKFADKVVAAVGSPLYGRTTYHMMENYWPTVLNNPDSSDREITHAKWVQEIPKVVFSTSLDKATWNNTTLIKNNVAEEVKRLKELPGKDLVIFGSPRLSHSFMEMDLIDGYVLTVSPVLLGEGTPLFKNVKAKQSLKLVKSEVMPSGALALEYEKS